MKKFNVKIVRKEIYVETIEVEAEDENSAIKEAERIDIEEGEIDWSGISDVEYNYEVKES